MGKTKIYTLRAAKALGLFALARRLTGRALRILAYHGIWMGEGHFGNAVNMSAARFSQRMSDLASSPYPVLGLGEALKKLENGGLPPCATVITLDDGWYSCYRHMFPEFEKHGFPATVYVTSHCSKYQVPVFDLSVRYMTTTTTVDHVDLKDIGFDLSGEYDLAKPGQRVELTRKLVEHGKFNLDRFRREELNRVVASALGFDYQEIFDKRLFHIMGADELRDLDRQGFDVQLHTHRHRISENGASCLSREISHNREWLSSFVQNKLEHFCYPDGKFNSSYWDELKASGVISATTTISGLNYPGAKPYALCRFLDAEELEWIEIEAELSGFLDVIRSIMGRRVDGY